MSDPSHGQRPKIVEELYDIGVIISESGPGLKVYMLVDRPGEYFDAQQRPVSERDAQRAGFNTAFYRQERRAKAIQDQAEQHAQRIRAQGAAALKEGLKSADEKLRARANRLAGEYLRTTAEVNQAAEQERQHLAKVRAAAQD
jgi:hypothetical protein